MPFYEYECENCKFYTEVLQKISDTPLKKCPSCGRNALKKLVSAPIFRLKGAGWYETDFKGDKENKRNLAVDKEPESAPSSSSEKASSAETKPASESKSDAAPAAPKASESKPAVSTKRPAAAKAKRPTMKAGAKSRAAASAKRKKR